MDWDKVQQLLEVVELSRGHPNLKAIHDAANHELDNMANPPVEVEETEEETEDE